MIDTHTHIYYPEFDNDIIEIMNRCSDSGVFHLILPNVDLESISYIKRLHSDFPLVTSMAMGLHPTEVKENWRDTMAIIEEELRTHEYVAVGEVGIDLYWDQTYLKEQKSAFEKQLILAGELNLPVIIHSRDALEETMESIEKINPKVPLIFHSFTGGPNEVERIRRSCDPYFGINGVVTYKNANQLREALPIIGIDRILLETDSPYLTPVPHRGKRNDSSLIIHVRDKIAETLGIEVEELEKASDLNACKVFKI